MTRSAIAGAALLLIGALIGLYFLVIKESPSASTPPSAPRTSNETGGSGTPTGTGPSLPTTGSAAAKPTADRDTTGLVLTDRRTSGSNVVLEGTEGSGGPPKRQLDGGLVRSIHRNAEAIMLGCAEKVPAADRGPRPRIGATLQVSIKDHELVVVGVEPKLSDLGGAQQKTAEECVRTLMMSFTAPTPDEADLDSYELHYQYVVK